MIFNHSTCVHVYCIKRKVHTKCVIPAHVHDLSICVNDSHYIAETRAEIESCLTQIDNCLQLLLPDPDSFNIFGLDSPDPAMVSKPFSYSSMLSNSAQRTSTSTVDSSTSDNADKVKNLTQVDSNSLNVQSDLKSVSKANIQTQGQAAETCTETSTENVTGAKQFQVPQQNDSNKQVSIPGGESEDDSSENFGEVSSSSDEEDEGGEERSNFLREYGLGSQKYSLDITVNVDNIGVQENDDNRDIIRTVLDLNTLVKNKFTPLVQRWMEVRNKQNEKYIKCIFIVHTYT